MQTIYQKAIDDINTQKELTKKKWSLENISLAKASLNQPEKFKNIQVVGTNGKGTTAHYLYHILLKQGYNVGLFTSPHLLDITERISFNGTEIFQEDFGSYYFRLIDVFSKYGLSYFEKLTLLAFLYFSEKNTDIVIWEAGLGGRFDATTTMECEIVLFTAIAMDHMEYLGSTIANIVFEKVYTIKNCVHALSIPQTNEVKDLMLNEANRYQKKIEFVSPVKNTQMGKCGTVFEHQKEKYSIQMIGKHYAQNIVLALAASKIIAPKINHKIAQKHIAEIKPWMGRLQFYNSIYGEFLLSCAHNENSLENDLETIKHMIDQKVLTQDSWVVFACTRERPADLFLEKIQKIFHNIVITSANDDFPVHPALQKYNQVLPIIENKKKLLLFLQEKQVKTAIVIGSIYLCGEIISVSSVSVKGND